MDSATAQMQPHGRGGQRQQQQHMRTKSASVLKSIIPSKSHKQQTDTRETRASRVQDVEPQHGGSRGGVAQILPADHPHAGQRALTELHNQSSAPSSPRKSSNTSRPRLESLYMKSKSSESTTTLGEEKEKRGFRSRRGKKDDEPKKSKSSTSLASLFKNNRSSKDLTASPTKSTKDKENRTPPSSSSNDGAATPIWAQFASQTEQVTEHSTTTKVPLNDDRTRWEEINRYTPQVYTPSKQKDYFGQEEPKLGKRSSRPRSVEIAASTAKSLFQPIARKASQSGRDSRKSSDEHRRKPGQEERRTTTQPSLSASSSPRKEMPQSPTKQSRVMAAVATFNDKAKDAEMAVLLDPKNIDAAFEAVLDSRNIPEPMRQKMRGLKPSVKADFIRSHKVDVSQATSSPAEEEKPAKKTDKKKSTKTKGAKESENIEDEDVFEDGMATPKRSRPRSRTFTFSKGDSPTKKQKGGNETPSHRRDKSIEAPVLKSPSSTSLAGSSSGDGSARLQKAQKTAAPGEFVLYLHKTTKPQDVEVGRLHKLRLLLRNETVAWVDAFIREGGMTEIIALLHRIMEVEWRYVVCSNTGPLPNIMLIPGIARSTRTHYFMKPYYASKA